MKTAIEELRAFNDYIYGCLRLPTELRDRVVDEIDALSDDLEGLRKERDTKVVEIKCISEDELAKALASGTGQTIVMEAVKKPVSPEATDIEFLPSKESIVAAAIQIEGVTISLPQPARHGQVIAAARHFHMPDYHIAAACQGFVTSDGRFVNRVMAYHIAHRAGQPMLRTPNNYPDLYSEDLW